MADSHQFPDPNDPLIQQDIIESAKWAISSCPFNLTEQDAFSLAKGYFATKSGHPGPAVEDAILNEARRQLGQQDFLAKGMNRPEPLDLPPLEQDSDFPIAIPKFPQKVSEEELMTRRVQQ
jgi:hypothetical protein